MTSGTQAADLEVVVVGAGVAGLTIAYGLRDVLGIKLRVFERRTEEECSSGGYPIHLSKEGREALQELLSPDDHTKLLAARAALPPAHDGITVQTSKGLTVWKMRKDPGERCMLERQDLCDILRHGAMDPDDTDVEGIVSPDTASTTFRPVIEYGRGVKSMKEVFNRWQLVLSDGEVVYCDLLIGADGMFSRVRQAVTSLSSSSKKSDFKRLPWTTINVRAQTPAVRSWVKDPRGMNLIYGTGWSAALIPLTLDESNESIENDIDDTTHSKSKIAEYTSNGDIVAEMLKLPHTLLVDRPSIEDALEVVVTEDVLTDGEPQVADGAKPKIDSSVVEKGTSDTEKILSPPQHTASTATYVALTVANPNTSLRDRVDKIPEAAIPGSFLHSLLRDPSFDKVATYPLITAKRTIVGSGRVILVGDASHAMVPFCGAGASAGVKDGVEVIKMLKEYINRGGDIESHVDRYGANQKTRNDPLIKQSRLILWLAQGEVWWKRRIRGASFWGLELSERMGKQRRKTDQEFETWLKGERIGQNMPEH